MEGQAGSNDEPTMYNTQCEDVVRTIDPNTATISKPVVISQYTKFMVEVDRADHYCGSYAFLRKTAKWWQKMLFWLLEVAIVNSYILFNLTRKQKELNKVRQKILQKPHFAVGGKCLKQKCK